MAFTPKKVFVLENGNYEEISYVELQKREKTLQEYSRKKYLPLWGTLMEVSKEEYDDYYKMENRRKYLCKRAKHNGEFSYESLDTEEFIGEDILIDEVQNPQDRIEQEDNLHILRQALDSLTENERRFLSLFFEEGESERTLAKKFGVSNIAIHKRKQRIFEKIRKFFVI